MDIKRKIAGITALCLAFTAGAAVSPRLTRAAGVFRDINGDGYVNAKDASVILGYVVLNYVLKNKQEETSK
ncbi:MAG: hypothetical protein IKP78_02665 [Ruminococcus sp.]|nr:hypothetical protein [Ruminococcus sp.]